MVAAAYWCLDNADNADAEFFVGVEFAYSGNIDDLKALVDKVKDYTNVFVIGALEISFNQTKLDESSDYVVNAGLHLIVFFTDREEYHYANNYTIFDWEADAKQKYGDMFLGVYRYDEPGGNQLDLGPSQLVENASDYTSMADTFTSYLNILISYHKKYGGTVITADYGLYWFDYRADYSAVFTEFGWNHSRPLHVALCRGAATAFNRDWGAIVTWTYTNDSYIESGPMLYSDLQLAYDAGAKYAVVFDYPKIKEYGILGEAHFDALKQFWNYTHSNPQSRGVNQAQAAYVLPKDYGFGFRTATDRIWGLFNADGLSAKVYNDTNTLAARYGFHLDIVYDDPATFPAIQNRYAELYFWNETIT